jgi:class 3 adenylate cyclase
VIGDAVNTANHLEALSRELDASIVISDDIVSRVREENSGRSVAMLDGLRRVGDRRVKGRQESVGVWILPRADDRAAAPGSAVPGAAARPAGL